MKDRMLFGRVFGVLLVSVVFTLGFASTAFADTITNLLDNSPGGEVFEEVTLQEGQADNVRFRLIPDSGRRPPSPDGDQGCNVDAGEILEVRFRSSNPAVAETEPAGTTRIFSGCGPDPADGPNPPDSDPNDIIVPVRGKVQGRTTFTVEIVRNTTGGGSYVRDAGTFVVNVGQRPDISINKDAPAQVEPGRSFDYELTASNNRAGAKNNVQIFDDLPDNVTYNDAASSPECQFVGQLDGRRNVVQCDVGRLTVGQSRSVRINVTAPQTTGAIRNQGAVFYSNGGDDSNLIFSNQTTTLVRPGTANLSITKADAPDPATVGQNLTYTLTVNNGGPTVARNVRVTDNLPQGATFVSATPSQGTCPTRPAAGATGGRVVCNLGDLAANGTATVQVVVKPTRGAAGTTIENTTNVQSDTRDPDPGNNDARATTQVRPEANLAITKESPATATNGQPFNYQLTVENNGPNAAQNVIVTDNLPDGFIYNDGASTESCELDGSTQDPNDVRCNLGQVPADGQRTLTINVTPTQTGDFTNTANAASDTRDPQQGNNTDSANTTVTPAADLTINKQAPDQVNDGEQFDFTLTVTNDGLDPAEGVTIKDQLPQGVSFVGASNGCTFNEQNNTVTCDVGTLAAGATAERVITAQAETPGDKNNTATVGSQTEDPNGQNNNDSTVTGINPSADLSITKTDAPDPVTNGENLTYTLTVNNDGPSPAADVTFSDTLPQNATFVGFDGAGDGCNYNQQSRTVTCDLRDLANGAEASRKIVVRPTEPGTLNNTAEVSTNTRDPNQNNNNDSAATQVQPATDLAAGKQGPDEVLVGEQFTYTLTVTNNGPDDATGVQILDQLPDGVSPVDGSSPQGCTFNGPDNTVICDIGRLQTGATAERNLQVSADSAGEKRNVARVSGDQRDLNGDNNRATATTQARPAADLSITKEKATPGPATFGESFEYTITVTNDGPSVARNVVVNDDLPEALTYNDGASSPECEPVADSPDSNDVRCTLGDLDPGQTREVTINVTPNRTGPVSNTATVNSATTDPNRGNNSSTARDDIQGANLQVNKSDGTPDGRVTAGSEFTYTITITNDGPAVAREVTLSDPLPDEVTFISIEADRDAPGDPACDDPDPDRVVRCELGTLAPDQTTEVRITVRAPNEGAEDIFNRATARSQNDPDGDRDGERTTTAEGSADLSLDKVSPAEVTDEDEFTYILTVENDGPSAARNVSVEDELPAEVEFVSVTSNRDTAGSPGCAEADGIVECDDLGDLATNGDPITVEITVRAKTPTLPGENGSRNEAEVSSAVSDPDRTNNRDAAVTRINAEADLAITKTAPDTVTDGSEFAYTLTVENAGPSTARNVTVTDELPDNVEFVSAGDGCNYSEQDNTVTCDIGALQQGGTAGREITVRATQPGESVNNANVETSTTDTNADNDSDSATTRIQASADLSVSKTDSEDPVAVGEQFTYTVEVTNNGPSAAQNAQLVDRLPDGVTPADPQNLPADCIYAVQDNTITCDLGTLGSGESVERQFDVTSDSEGQKTNEAEVTSDTPDPRAGNDTATEDTTVRSEADLSITKTDDADPVTFGNELTYTLTVRNAGPNPAANVRVVDQLPDNVTFQDVSSNRDSINGPTCEAPDQPNQPGGTINCAFGQVGATGDDPIRITIVVKPTAGAVGNRIRNTATVDSSTFDPDDGDRNASEGTDVNAANVEITKVSDPERVRANQEFEYVLTVNNTTGVNARDVTVTDTLPSEVTFVSVDPATSADCTYNENDPDRDDDNTVTCEPFDLAGNAEAQRRFTVQAPAQPPEDGTIRNIATVRTPNDPRGDRDTETDTFVGARADLTLQKEAPAEVTDEEEFTYTLTVTNKGPSAAAGVIVADDLPDGVQFIRQGTDERCENEGGAVRCDLGTLGAGEPDGGIKLSIRVRAKEPGPQLNVASVSSGTRDPNNDNDRSREVTTTVAAVADLKIEKRAPGQVTDGGRFNYTLTVTNSGPSTARGVAATDKLPGGVRFLSAPDCRNQGGTVRCGIGDLDPGASAKRIIRVEATSPGKRKNTAAVDTTTGDPNDQNNNDSATTRIQAQADLAIDKRGPARVTDENRFTYTLVVKNKGPSNASGVRVADTLPGGVRFLSASGGCSQRGGVVRCGPFNLAEGASRQLKIAVQAKQPGRKVNRVSVSRPAGDPNAQNNRDAVATVIRPEPAPPRPRPQACNPNIDGKTIFGTPGNDVLRGTRGNDRIFGFGGNDLIVGGGGEDQIIGGDGSDTIRGGACGDTIKANDGNNRVYGEGGGDVMDGGKDRDLISGGESEDVFMGNGGRDRLIARDGRKDVVNGGSGQDECLTDRKDGKAGCP